MIDWDVMETGQVLSIIPDDSPAIDFVLEEQLVKKIYSSWDESKYGQLLDFGGGVRAITISMLKGAGADFLKKIRGVGAARARAIMEDVNIVAKEGAYGSPL